MGRGRGVQQELQDAARAGVVMGEGPGGPVGRSGSGDGYLRAHLMPALRAMRGPEWGVVSTRVVRRGRQFAGVGKVQVVGWRRGRGHGMTGSWGGGRGIDGTGQWG